MRCFFALLEHSSSPAGLKDRICQEPGEHHHSDLAQAAGSNDPVVHGVQLRSGHSVENQQGKDQGTWNATRDVRRKQALKCRLFGT